MSGNLWGTEVGGKELVFVYFLEFPNGLAVKDLALSLMWLEFDSWPGNFRIPWELPKKKKKKDETSLDIFSHTAII